MTGLKNLADIQAAEARLFVDLPDSTYSVIQQTSLRTPDAPALSFFLSVDQHRTPEVISYQSLLANIHRAANLFTELGATKGTRIAFILPNLPETHFVIWGGQAAGIVVPLNPLLDSAALGTLLQATAAEIIVTLAPFPTTDLWSKVRAQLEHLPSVRHLVLVDLARRLPALQPPLVDDSPAASRAAPATAGLQALQQLVPKSVQLHDFHAGLARQPAERLRSERQIAAEDHSSWFCTGGTTGLPKLAMRTHRNEVANAWSLNRVFGDLGDTAVAFCGLPLFHVNAVMVTGLAPFATGSHVLLGTPQGYRSPGLVQRFWEVVAHHRVTHFSGVPTLYASLLQVPLGNQDISSLLCGLCGAAPMPREVTRAFETLTQVPILEGYGLTEGTCVSSATPRLAERRPGSIGMRIPGQKMKCVVLDDLGAYVRDCQPGEVGSIIIAGPNVFVGYHDPVHNQGLWLDCGDSERWLNTGDLGCSDEDGFFWITGRKKELIIRGGHNIDPSAIEEPLHRHPAVQLVAAVGRPDLHAGELPIAYVQLRPGSQTTARELETFAKTAITERAAIPKEIHIIDAMPVTGVGKIFKPDLKRREALRALLTALEQADIEVAALEVLPDAERGMRAHVTLSNPAQAVAAESVLGRFTVPYILQTANAGNQ